MPLIDLKCKSETCGEAFEYMRPLSEWPATPPCPTCHGDTEQTHQPRSTQWTMDPVVIFESPDGTARFPGAVDGQSAANYARMGYTRHELRSAADVRRFEKSMNAREFSMATRKAERQQEQREAREHETRAELYSRMKSMTPLGRAVARVAIARNDAKARPRAKDPGFHSEVFSYDRSNREDSRGSDGRRRRS